PRYKYEVWWRSDAAGLHVLVAGRVRTYPVNDALRGITVTSVNRDKSGTVWVRTNSDRVLEIRDGRIRVHSVEVGMLENVVAGTLHGDRTGTIWLTQFNGRTLRIRGGTAELVCEAGLISLFEDRDGSIWLGTNGLGLYRMRDITFSVYSEKDGLAFYAAYPLLFDRRGTLWVGAVALHRFEHGHFTVFGKRHGLAEAQVTALGEDRSGRLWIGTDHGPGIFANERFTPYGDADGPLRSAVWAIHEDRRGRMWFATNDGLVLAADGRTTRYTIDDGLTHNRVTALHEDGSGALWIGGFRGVTRLADGHFVQYDEREGLVGSWIRAIHEDADGAIWIGTYDSGLYRIAAGRLSRFTRREGLHDNGIFQILEDDDGYLWTGSNVGISRVSRRELNDVAEGRRATVNPMVFGVRDGLLSTEINGGSQPSGWKAADGRLWFPTMAGVAVVDPKRVRVDSTSPTALIEDFQIAGQSRELRATMTVPADASTFTIRYTAPTFIKPEQIRFRYRLDGLDRDWLDAGDARSATYHRTPPGTYEFTVVAANHDGVWSTIGGGVRIVVLPPFWRTWWFAALSAAALVALVVIGHEMRMRGMRRQHARQAAFSRQLIESQEHERRRIASELHDALGHDLAIIRQRARTSRELHARDDGFARELTTIIGAAQRIDADVKNIAYGLRPYQLDTIGLSKTIDHMVRSVAEACAIDCVADIAAIDDALPPNARIHVYRIVQECLNNIARHSKATRAEIVIGRTDRALTIRVSDNGVGVHRDNLAAPRSTSGGFGFMGIRERARILGGEVELRSGVHEGTTVLVSLPLEPDA
ncbi:MAG TPA: two-component regulator propeller domain-containing protein, partial [Vicinamibacterales bacterium]|nr:two-component regulator propeller domain-containing protein [Vicinamibacterales bacterium]